MWSDKEITSIQANRTLQPITCQFLTSFLLLITKVGSLLLLWLVPDIPFSILLIDWDRVPQCNVVYIGITSNELHFIPTAGVSNIWTALPSTCCIVCPGFLEIPAAWGGVPPTLLAPCWAILFKCPCKTESLHYRCNLRSSREGKCLSNICSPHSIFHYQDEEGK